MMLRSVFALLFSVAMLVNTVLQPADAKWFGKKSSKKDEAVEKVRTYQPPPENAIALYCEPYRQEAVELSHKPRLLKIFYAPRRGWAIRKHRECKDSLMQQEHTYLKHVDIERAPSLPKLKTDIDSKAQPQTGASDASGSK
jgi:hypothetical protein